MGVRNGVAWLALECRLWGQALHNSGRRVQVIALGVVVAVAVPGAAMVVAVAGNSGSSPTAVEPVSVAELAGVAPFAGTSERTGLPAPELLSGLIDVSELTPPPSGPAKSEDDDKPAAKPDKQPDRSVVTAPVPVPPARPQPVTDRTPPQDSGAGSGKRSEEKNDKKDSGRDRDDRRSDDRKRDDRKKEDRKNDDRDREAPIAASDPANPNSNDEPQVAKAPAGRTPPNDLPAGS